MKKRIFTLLVLVSLSSFAYAQMGVNTTSPETTLDVRAKNHLGAVTATDGLLIPRVSSLATAGSVNGQLVYLIADNGGFIKGFHYWNGTAWTPFTGGGTGAGDPTKDAWVDNTTNGRVEVGTLSDGVTNRPTGTEVVIKDDGKMGIGTPTPASTVHVNGDLSLVKDLKVGGNETAAGSSGAAGQVLVSNGPGLAPSWKVSNELKGGLIYADIFIGTATSGANQGETIYVPGLAGTLTVPAGRKWWCSFVMTGIANNAYSDGGSIQGVFSLVVDGVKVSSAFTSAGTAGNLLNLPHPISMLKGIYLNEGTHTYKIQYKSWLGAAYVNYIPTDYGGYDNDAESFKSKLHLMAFQE